MILDDSMDHNLSLIELSKDYSMLVGRLYKLGDDRVLRLCIEAKEMLEYLRQAHIRMGDFHMSPKQTFKQVERMRLYWSTMQRDIDAYVRNCSCHLQMITSLFALSTLYSPFPTTPK